MEWKRGAEVVAELTERQHGVVSRRQLRERGVPHRLVQHRLDIGSLEPLSRRVLRLRGAPFTDMTHVAAGVLDAGPMAAVSHRTAAAIWGLPGFDLRPVHATGRRPRVAHSRQDLSIVHQPLRLLEAHVVESEGLRITTPSRMIFDLAGDRGLHPKRVERALDTAWSMRIVDHDSLHRMLRDLAARGRPGIALMRSLLAQRPVGHRPAGSNAERRFQEIAASVGLRSLVRQVNVGDEDGWVGRVDFRDPVHGLVVEVNPDRFHGSLLDQQRDGERHARLRAAGFDVVSIDERMLFFDRPALEALLRPYVHRAA